MSSSATADALQPATVSRPSAPLFISGEKRSAVLCLLLGLLVIAFYNPVVHNKFTNMDDNAYITDNVHVQAGLTWDTVKWAFTTFEASNWHPLTWLSHALDCQIFGLNPVGPHYVNVLLHATNALLLFLLLQGATGLTGPSFTVAALFALHPVNVESVAWAAERKNVLSMLFFLLTLHAYGWYVRRESFKRYAAMFALFALGLMAKPEIITLPFVLLLWDYWPLRRMGGGTASEVKRVFTEKFASKDDSQATPSQARRSFSFLVLEKLLLFLLSAASATLTLLAQRSHDTLLDRDFSQRARFGNAVVAYVRYLGKFFWPSRLASLYPHPGDLLPGRAIVGSAAVLFVITALVLIQSRRRYLAVGWFWFLGTLFPVIGLVQAGAQAMADRYAYLSFIGLFVVGVWAIAEVSRERKVSNALLAVPAVLVLATLGTLTARQIPYWHDSISLWRHTLDVTPPNYFAHNALGEALAQQGRSEEAIVEFDAAERLHQFPALSMVGFAAYKRMHGHVPDAIAEYRRALEVSPDSKIRSIVLSRLASAYMQAGDFVRARASCEKALLENPNNGSALVASGLLAQKDGDFTNAIAQFSRAMKVAPTDVGYLLLSQALYRSGDVSGAEQALTMSRQISRDFAQAQANAAEVLAAAGLKGY
jgi:protein O-mannosyl-transferase